MELQKFKDVHPDWSLIENLAVEEVPAVVNLLLGGLFLRGKLSVEELGLLAETWERLPWIGRGFEGQGLGDHIQQTHGRLLAILKNPELFDDFLDEASSRITDDDKRRAVLRLLALSLNESDLGPRQYDYFYAVTSSFEFSSSQAEDILRLAWESYQDHLRAESGDTSFKPLVQSHHLSASSSRERGSSPFTYGLG